MVASFDQRDFVPRFVAVGQRLNPGGRRALAVEHDPAPELLEVARLRMAFQFDVISPRNGGSAQALLVWGVSFVDAARPSVIYERVEKPRDLLRLLF